MPIDYLKEYTGRLVLRANDDSIHPHIPIVYIQGAFTTEALHFSCYLPVFISRQTLIGSIDMRGERMSTVYNVRIM